MIEIAYDEVVHTSDHFDKIQEHTERLIKQGDAFMDDTDAETVSWLVCCVTSGCSSSSAGQGATESGDSVKEPGRIRRAELGSLQGYAVGLRGREEVESPRQDRLQTQERDHAGSCGVPIRRG